MSEKLHPTEVEKNQIEIELAKKRLEIAELDRQLYENRITDWQDRRKENLAGLDKNRVYRFMDEVGPRQVESAIEMMDYWSRRDPGEDIVFELNSPGGSVLHGLALYDFLQELRRRGHHVTTIARGMAASMGGVLLQAGDVRVMDENAHILIHEVSSVEYGKLSDIEDGVKFSKLLWEQRLATILAERSNLTRKQIIAKAARKDWWFGAEHALEYGFVDEVQRFPLFPGQTERKAHA